MGDTNDSKDIKMQEIPKETPESGELQYIIIDPKNDDPIDTQFWKALDDEHNDEKLRSIIENYDGDFEIFFQKYEQTDKSCFEKLCSTKKMDNFSRCFFFCLGKKSNFKDIKTKYLLKKNELLKFAIESENFGCFWRLCQLIGLDNVNRLDAIDMIDKKLKETEDKKKISKMKHTIRTLIVSKKKLTNKESHHLFDFKKNHYSEYTADVLIGFVPGIELTKSIERSYIQKIPKETDSIIKLMKHIQNGDETSFMKDIKRIPNYQNESFSKDFRINGKFYTIFQLSCEKGLKNIIVTLLKTNCDPNMTTKYNDLPITLAFLNCRPKVLNVLISDERVKYNKNILLNMLRHLIHKKKLNSCNINDYTECLNVLKNKNRASVVFACSFYLKLAIKMNHESSILFLLKHGASVNFIDESLDGISRTEYVLENLPPKIFEAHLDECLWMENHDSRTQYIEMNFNFLKPILLNEEFNIEKLNSNNRLDKENAETDSYLRCSLTDSLSCLSSNKYTMTSVAEMDKIHEEKTAELNKNSNSEKNNRIKNRPYNRKGKRNRAKIANERLHSGTDESIDNEGQSLIDDENSQKIIPNTETNQLLNTNDNETEPAKGKSRKRKKKNSPVVENEKPQKDAENAETDQPLIEDKAEKVLSEMDILLRISKVKRLRPFIKHPVIQSFLHLKWQKAKWLFWANFLYFFFFCVFLVVHVFLDSTEGGYNAVTVFLWISLVILIFREFIQIYSYPIFYVKSYENWIELITFTITILVLVLNSYEVRVYLSVFAIFLASVEFVILMAKFSMFSIYYTMLKSVIWIFFKFIGAFSVIFVCFALIFYKLFHEVEIKPNQSKSSSGTEPEEYNFFLTLSRSIFKTIVMFIGELEAGKFNFDSFPGVSHVMFVLFIIIVTIVLYNFLNGLAISDIQVMRNDAELVTLIHRIQSLSNLETVTFGAGIVDDSDKMNMKKLLLALFSKRYSYYIKRKPFIPYLAKKMSLFPDIYPFKTIRMSVNRSENVILRLFDDNSTKKSSKSSCSNKKLPKMFDMDKNIMDLAELKIKEKFENKMECERKMNFEKRLKNIEEVLQKHDVNFADILKIVQIDNGKT